MPNASFPLCSFAPLRLGVKLLPPVKALGHPCFKNGYIIFNVAKGPLKKQEVIEYEKEEV